VVDRHQDFSVVVTNVSEESDVSIFRVVDEDRGCAFFRIKI
jgi:hypothetical protein